MSVSVSMPQLGESVTEGTVTRWLKQEGEHVSADEPLLEVSTDKVDTEIPSPVSGILRGISVAEDETVAVGAELAVIDEDGAASGGQDADARAGGTQAAQAPAPEPPESPEAPASEAAAPPAPPAQPQQPQAQPQPPQPQPGQPQPAQGQQQDGGYPYQRYQHEQYRPEQYQPEQYQQPVAGYQPATGYEGPPSYAGQGPDSAGEPYAQPGSYQVPAPTGAPQAPYPPADYQPADAEPPAPAGYQPPTSPYPSPEQTQPPAQDGAGGASAGTAQPAGAADSPYVTPLVRKLAAEHGIDLATVTGTGVGGRIRKQDVLDASRQQHGGEAPRPAAAPQAPPPPPASAGAPAPVSTGTASQPSGPATQPSVPRTIPAPSSLRGGTERLSRARQVIAQRMVESLQTSAQLTTVVEADVTAIARLRDRYRAAFEAREGVKLSFLPFFALATVEALKAHPKLNALIDTSAGTITYHDAEHLGIAVDTERGLMVPVIRNAGDLNIGGLARKIADLAARTRAGQVSPDDLSGGTFTLTNTGSRGALFDTPIINQPQVGILGTGTVNKRAVVVDDPDLGEVITVRSIVYLALTYDHRLVDGADAARFLVTIKNRLEEGAFEAELGR
jgi:pyruvate dehydrogenase E2 component (dihydrolipoamide acetyltransferase)